MFVLVYTYSVLEVFVTTPFLLKEKKRGNKKKGKNLKKKFPGEETVQVISRHAY